MCRTSLYEYEVELRTYLKCNQVYFPDDTDIDTNEYEDHSLIAILGWDDIEAYRTLFRWAQASGKIITDNIRDDYNMEGKSAGLYLQLSNFDTLPEGYKYIIERKMGNPVKVAVLKYHRGSNDDCNHVTCKYYTGDWDDCYGKYTCLCKRDIDIFDLEIANLLNLEPKYLPISENI